MRLALEAYKGIPGQFKKSLYIVNGDIEDSKPVYQRFCQITTDSDRTQPVAQTYCKALGQCSHGEFVKTLNVEKLY